MLAALRLAAGTLIVAICLLLGAVGIGRFAPASWLGQALHPTKQAAGANATPLATLAIGGPFSLLGPDGRTVTQASYPGRWMLIYFGYTSCPDVCPTTLQAMAAALDQLGGMAGRIVPVFISIDPARDHPDTVARYTALFDRRIVGLTGTPQQTEAAERSFRVYAARVEQPGGGNYLMDHTSFVYLLDPQGRLRALFDRDATAASMAAQIRRVLA